MNALTSPAVETPTTALIELSSVTFGYDDEIVFSGIDLKFRAGEMVGIIGPNGSGKTTLLRLVMGTVSPQLGMIRIRGRALTSYPRRYLAQTLSLVPQDTQIGYAFTVKEIVAMGRNPYLGRFRPPAAEDETRVVNAMRETRVADLADRPISTLSGGERQRVLIARAIAQQTAIVLLDEATANLDICHQLEVMELSKHLALQGRLVIAAIHDLALASRYCNRLVLLANKRISADGAPENVLTEQSLRQQFSLHAKVRPNADLEQGLSITPIAPV